jgi:hypothetical protein
MLPWRLSDARESCSVPIAPGGRTLGATVPGPSNGRGHHMVDMRSAYRAGSRNASTDSIATFPTNGIV